MPQREQLSQEDATIPQKVDALLAQMTPEEKIGQMALFKSSGTVTGPSGEPQDLEDLIRKGDCGGVFNAHTVAKICHLQRIAVEDAPQNSTDIRL